MNQRLQAMANALALQLWGRTPAQAHANLICVCCGTLVSRMVHDWKTEDFNEYSQSALCPACFTNITKED